MTAIMIIKMLISFDSNNKNFHTFHKISDSKAIKKFATQKKFFEISDELIGSKSKFENVNYLQNLQK